MFRPVRLKTALLAAGSLAAASVAFANAADAPATHPVAIEHAVTATDHGELDRPAPALAKQAGLAVIAAGALAALLRAIGFQRISALAKATAATAGRAAAAGADLTVKAARSVARAVSVPVRYLAALAGLGVAAIAGIGVFDLEWTGGLVVGAGLASVVFAAMAGFEKIGLRRKPQT